MANDPSRPFLLSVGRRQFEADGPSSWLNLRRVTAENTELIVMEGRVRALNSRIPSSGLTAAQLRGQPTKDEQTFNAMEGGNFEAGRNFAWSLTSTELLQKLAWQQGSIDTVD